MSTTMNTKQQPLLSIRGLQVAYGGIQAVKGVDMDVYQGELVTLIGANGAGKTTTLKALMGLLPYKNGDITFQGKSIKGVPTQKRPRTRNPHRATIGKNTFGISLTNCTRSPKWL